MAGWIQGIYASYAAHARDAVVAARLYLPVDWTGDPAVATNNGKFSD